MEKDIEVSDLFPKVEKSKENDKDSKRETKH